MFNTLIGHQDTHHNHMEHNDTQHNNIQHNNTQHNDIQHNSTQHDSIQHHNKQNATLSIVALDTQCCYCEGHLCWGLLMLSATNKPFVLSVFMLNAIKVSVIMLSVVLSIYKLKATFILAFHIPSNMTRPMRYCGNVLQTCAKNKSTTTDSRYCLIFA